VRAGKPFDESLFSGLFRNRTSPKLAALVLDDVTVHVPPSIESTIGRVAVWLHAGHACNTTKLGGSYAHRPVLKVTGVMLQYWAAREEVQHGIVHVALPLVPSHGLHVEDRWVPYGQYDARTTVVCLYA
jgi:hypothetical protein